MLKANIEAQIEAKEKVIAAAESDIVKLDNLINILTEKRSKMLEIRGLAAYDLMELREQLEEDN